MQMLHPDLLELPKWVLNEGLNVGFGLAYLLRVSTAEYRSYLHKRESHILIQIRPLSIDGAI